MAALAIPLAISGISALAGAFGNRAKKTTQATNQTTNQNQSGTATTTPNYDPQTQALRDALTSAYGQSLNEDVDLSGYKAQGISEISKAGDARTQAIQNSLASRGLSYSPVASYAPVVSDSARIGDTASFINSIPLLQRQLRDQRLAAAGSYLKGLPIGQTTSTQQSGTSTLQGEGNVVEPGNILGGSLGSLATTLAGLYGYGAFNNKNGKTKTPGTPPTVSTGNWPGMG